MRSEPRQPQERRMDTQVPPQAPGRTPGEEFAHAFAADPEKAEVHFDFTLTDAFQPGRERRRLTARNLFRKHPVDTDTVRSWHETRPEAAPAGTVSGLREDAFHFSLAEYRVARIDAWVQIPDGLADEPE